MIVVGCVLLRGGAGARVGGLGVDVHVLASCLSVSRFHAAGNFGIFWEIKGIISTAIIQRVP
jgi:hypothetical protein